MYLIYPYDGFDEQNSYQYFKDEEEILNIKEKLHLNILFFDVSKNEDCFVNPYFKEDQKYKIFTKQEI